MMRPSLMCTLRRQLELQNWQALSTILSACNAPEPLVKSKPAGGGEVFEYVPSCPASASVGRRPRAEAAAAPRAPPRRKLRREGGGWGLVVLDGGTKACARDNASS